jgi:importin-5
VFAKLGNSNQNHRESALFLLSKICEYAVDIVKPHVAKLHSAVGAGLSNAQPMNVRIAALGLCCSWMLSTKDANQSDKSKFMAFMPGMLSVVSDALNKGNEVEAQESLTKLIDLLRVDPDTCKSSMAGIAGGMMQVAAAKSLEPATRKLALETVVQMCESTPALARKCTPLITKIFPLSLSMICECEEDDFEPDDYTPPDQDTDSSYLVGESCVLRITMALGKIFVPQLLAHVQALANSTNWVQRRACCVAIGTSNSSYLSLSLSLSFCSHLNLPPYTHTHTHIRSSRLAPSTYPPPHNTGSVVNGGGRSVRKQLKPHLAALLQMLMAKIRNDPHQWVRFEAIHCVAAICSAYESHVQEQFHAIVAEGLASAMVAGSRNCMRVRGHAASAAQIFARPGKCEEENLKPHAHILLVALCNLLKTGTRSVQEEALTAVACIAKVIEANFGPYYNEFMPGIKSILGQAVTKENRPLQAKAIECLGLIAESVGPQRFGADATAAMNLIMSLQGSGLPADDPRAPELMQCAVRGCLSSSLKCENVSLSLSLSRFAHTHTHIHSGTHL